MEGGLAGVVRPLAEELGLGAAGRGQEHLHVGPPRGRQRDVRLNGLKELHLSSAELEE